MYGNLNKVVLVGPQDGYVGKGVNTSVSRMRGLSRLNLNVIPFDSAGFAGSNKWMQRLNHRLYAGPSVRRLNAQLIQVVADTKPDVVWVDKGFWIYPGTLAQLKKHARYLVHYNTDDTLARANRPWLHLAGIRHYDLFITTNRWNVAEVRISYGIRTMRAGMGYDAAEYPPSSASLPESQRPPIVFVGHREPHSERFLSTLQERGHSVHVWGSHWSKAKNPSFRSARVLQADSYVSTIANARIALCFLSRRNRNESTGRSFEIPAIGTFLLAERTLEHEFLYGDGLGAGLFSDAEELAQKVEYYLSHPQELRQVAAEGHRRCLALGLSWEDHMRREWPLAERLLLSGSHLMGPIDADEPFWPGFRTGMAYAPQTRAAFSGPV